MADLAVEPGIRIGSVISAIREGRVAEAFDAVEGAVRSGAFSTAGAASLGGMTARAAVGEGNAHAISKAISESKRP